MGNYNLEKVSHFFNLRIRDNCIYHGGKNPANKGYYKAHTTKKNIKKSIQDFVDVDSGSILGISN